MYGNIVECWLDYVSQGAHLQHPLAQITRKKRYHLHQYLVGQTTIVLEKEGLSPRLWKGDPIHTLFYLQTNMPTSPTEPPTPARTALAPLLTHPTA
jgi:hypothetical protein